MLEKTYLKGKDACLEDSIQKMQALLKNAGFDIEEASWLNPVPNVYSVHIRDKHCPSLFTNGKGVSKKACLASALGEFFERLQTNYFFSDFYLDERLIHDNDHQGWTNLYYPDEKRFELSNYQDCLTPDLWQLYDSDHQLEPQDLLSLNDKEHSIGCLPMTRVSDQSTVYFPMNLLSNLYASNGLCAGNTFLEAQVQGLSEVFERWVKRTILLENLCLPEVPEQVLEKFPDVLAARDALSDELIDVSIRDASLGGHFPVINVTLFDQKSGQCFASFGSHPIFEVALERTLTESLQGRSLDALDGFQTPVFDERLVSEDENIENHFIDSSGLIHARFISHEADFEFAEWNFEGNTQEQFNYLVKKIQEQGTDVYIAEYDNFGMPSSRLIVPGMSEVFPLNELIENNQNYGRILREGLDRLAVNPCLENFEEVLDIIDGLGLSDHQGVANLIGLLPDGHSYWKKFKIVELSMWCLLAIKDYEGALNRLNDCFYFVDDETMKQFYKALQFGLEILIHDEKELFPHSVQAKLFGQELVEKVWCNIEGKEYFGGLSVGENAFKSSRAHLNLLRTYTRIQKHK